MDGACLQCLAQVPSNSAKRIRGEYLHVY